MIHKEIQRGGSYQFHILKECPVYPAFLAAYSARSWTSKHIPQLPWACLVIILVLLSHMPSLLSLLLNVVLLAFY
jgi:hypothetical protein